MKTNPENAQTLPTLPTLPFGMHKGAPLADVPASYLAWLLRSCKLSSGLRQSVASELQGRGVDVPSPPAAKPVRPCHRCGSLDHRYTWQEDRRGNRRIRRSCRSCGRFCEFAPMTEPFVSEANANASPAPTLDALLLAEAEGIELASDGKTVWIAGDRRKASEQLQNAVRQRGHLLASLLGKTQGA